ncbi:MAG: N-acetylmuramoyl-L-alanine amidase [Thermoanaerobaculia bacterium]|nr:N-acetylmuramoyl-L-alanine amidase [Thermoanaerobaculia bacterium]
MTTIGYRNAGLAPALVLAAGLLGAFPVRAEVRAGFRSEQIARTGADFAGGLLEAGVSVRSDGLRASRTAGFESAPIDTGATFSAVGPHWRGTPGVTVELAVSPDGVRWGSWIAVPEEGTIDDLREDGSPNPFAGESAGALVFVAPESRWVRYRIGLPGTARSEARLTSFTLHVIDPGTEAATARASSLPPAAAPAGTRSAPAAASPIARRALAPPPEIPTTFPGPPSPPISSRASWGARPPKAAYTYTVANHIGFHHTATIEDWSAETWEECAARVRAIQTYHMDTNGWNDIGYGYVVCKHGHVFQAREDDDDTTDVQGAHDGFNRGSAGISVLGYFHPPVDHRPTAAQVSSLVDLMAWIAGRRGIDPLGRSLYEAFGAPVDTVYGHREVKATDCPGDHLFALKELIRASVAERVVRLLY